MSQHRRNELTRWKRQGTIAPHTARDIARLQARITRLTSKVHQHLGSDPDTALGVLISLCKAYRSLARLAVLNMAGSLFIAESCAARAGKKQLSRKLDRLGMKYLNRAVPDDIPEPFLQFLVSLDAMKLLPPRQSRLAKEMKRLAAEAAEARRDRRRPRSRAGPGRAS